MKNTPSALKWLAERRARLAGDLGQVERVLIHLQGRRARLAEDLAAVDRSIRLYNERIDPSSIDAVSGHQPNYGKRGALKEAILQVFELHSPGWLSTSDLALAIIAQFNLAFPTAMERKQWYCSSLRGAVKRLAASGTLERDHYQEDPTGEVVRWRLNRNKPGLEALEQSATAAAVAMAQAQS